MKQLRNIGLDLIEKRLWPVAVALILGFIAVPAVLGADPEPEPVSLPTAGATAQPIAAQVAAAQQLPPTGLERPGALRDPFARRKAPIPTTKLAPTPMGNTGGKLAPLDNGSGGLPPLDFAPLPDFSLPDVPTTPPGPKPVTTPGGDLVTVRVGRSGELRTRPDVEARTPLPSVDDPFLVFLGTKPDGVSAQFLVSADAVPTGDGTCAPSAELCEQIVLQAGMTEFFDVTQPDGSVVQYQLDVVRVGPATK